jgi:hypothetical protein
MFKTLDDFKKDKPGNLHLKKAKQDDKKTNSYAGGAKR